MIYPEYIIPEKSLAAVTAPSDGNETDFDYARLDMAKANIRAKGVPVLETANVRSSNKGRSSSGKERGQQFMQVWSDQQVAVVFAAKGGDFLMEMLPYVDYEYIKNNPKWFQGYSDNTGLAFTITTLSDVASVYCNNFNDFAMKEWHESIVNNWNILCGNIIEQHNFDTYQDGFFEGTKGDESYNATAKVEWKLAGAASGQPVNVSMSGRVLGGCLDVLLNLVGTGYDKVAEFADRYSADGIMWYMESFALNSESIERGLWQLGEAGWFNKAKGFIFGRPAFFGTDTDTTYEEAVMNVLARYNVPVIINADIGHKPPQLTMVNGAIGQLDFDGINARLTYTYD